MVKLLDKIEYLGTQIVPAGIMEIVLICIGSWEM